MSGLFPNYMGAGRARDRVDDGINSANLEAIMRALNGKRNGSTIMARCPVHGDRNPSLAIKLQDGKVLVYCHAGCSQADVIRALRTMGTWPEARAIASPRKTENPPRIVATYDYVDKHGTLLYQVVRFEPKSFRQRRPDGRGDWTWRGPADSEKVLYRLPEVLKAYIVFLVEGEKDVDALREYGFVATTNAGGAKQPWLPQYTAALAGREVVLIPDADEPGRRHMEQVGLALHGYAKQIQVVHDLGEKDISDWLARGHSESELIRALDCEERQPSAR